jgi:hypothetical protein
LLTQYLDADSSFPIQSSGSPLTAHHSLTPAQKTKAALQRLMLPFETSFPHWAQGKE